MLEYKPSRYNCTIENNTGELIIYNSYSGDCYKVQADQKEKVCKMLLNKTQNKEQIPQELINSGFLLPAYADEDDMLESRYLDVVNNPILEICVITTEQCNFRCEYCFEELDTAPQGAMSIEVQDAIIHYVRKCITYHRGLQVTFFGGEPLLATHVISYLSKAFLDICKRQSKLYYASISTNGYHLTKEIFEKLLSYHVFYYQITIDGLQQTHDKQRHLCGGGGTFETIMKNMEDIRDHVKKRFTISLRTNCTREIACHLKDYVQFITDFIGTDDRFKIYFDIAEDWGGSITEDIKVDLFSPEKGKRYNTLLFYEKVIPLMKDKRILERDWFHGSLKPKIGICGYAKKDSISVSAVGEIHKCGIFFQGDNNNSIGKVNHGKIEIDPIKAASWRLYFHECDKSCLDCFLRPVCLVQWCTYGRFSNKYIKERSSNCVTREEELWKRLLLLYDHCGYVHPLNLPK